MNPKFVRFIAISIIGLAGLIGSGCAPTPQPTPRVTVIAIASPTSVPATVAPQPTSAPIPSATTPAATSVPIPTQVSGPTPTNRRISFAPGAITAIVQGTVAANGTDRWLVATLAGQTMSINIVPTQGQVVLAVTGMNGITLLIPTNVLSWNVSLPTSQDYLIDVISADGVAASYSLQVTIPPLPTATPVPVPATQRITFPPGGSSATMSGNLPVNGIDRYVLRVLAGQRMIVNATSAQANLLLSVSGADGQVLKSSGAGGPNWDGLVPSTQDYVLTISTVSSAATGYTLQVTVPPATSVYEPTPVPKRISFAPGAISATVSGALAKNGMDRWVVKASAGQTLMVNSVPQNGKVLLVIFGVDGTVLQTDHVEVTNYSGVLPITEDYYIDVRAWNDTAPTYSLQVTIPPR